MSTLIRVVSLQQSPRRRAFSGRALDAGVEWSFFDAECGLVDGLVYDEGLVQKNVGRSLSKGEIGCYSSHFVLWQELIASGHSQMIVLEDDTVVDWAYIAQLCKFDLEATGIDWLRLYAKVPSKYRVLSRPTTDHRRHIVEFLNFAVGTQGYAITRSGAIKFVRHCRVVQNAIDTEMDRFWVHGIRNLCVYPFPLFELTGESNIGGERGFLGAAGGSLERRGRLRILSQRALAKVQKTLYPIRSRPVSVKLQRFLSGVDE